MPGHRHCPRHDAVPDRARHPLTNCNDEDFRLLRHFFFIAPLDEALWAEFSADPRAIFEIEDRSGRFPRVETEKWPMLTAEKVYRVLDAFFGAWPQVNLPSSWGSGDPDDERAYRFLRDVVYRIGNDDPPVAIPFLDRVCADRRFNDYEDQIKSLRAELVRK